MEFMKASVLACCARLYEAEAPYEPEEVSVDFLHSSAWTYMAVDVFPEEHPINAKTCELAEKALMAALDDPENVQQAPEYAEYFAKRQRTFQQGLA
ncbi:hypothetical protein V8F33_007295 [Rhypophila sp. PSN 637]